MRFVRASSEREREREREIEEQGRYNRSANPRGDYVFVKISFPTWLVIDVPLSSNGL